MAGARDVERELLQAIVEHPEDDTPRLVYADWCSDRGDLRGELIAVQCAMARLAYDDDRRPVLEARDRELRARHDDVWRPGLAAMPGFDRGYLHRGFVGRVVFAEAELAARAPALFAAAPALTELYLMREAASEPRVPAELAQVRAIRFESTAFALACLASPHLASLESLELGDACDGGAIARALVRSDRATLRALEVSRTGLGAAGLTALFSWPGARGLRRFEARNSGLAAGEVARSPNAAGLERLGLADNALGDAGVAALVTSPHLTGLVTLDLSGTGGGGAIARATLPGLRTLRYGWNRLVGRGAVALAGCAALGGLEELSLYGRNDGIASTLDVDGAAAIVASTALGRLTTIDLQQNYFADGATAVAGAFRPGFRAIDLGWTRIDERGARALAENPNLASVATLNLANNPLGTAGFAALASSPHLRPRTLDLGYTEPGARGIATLAASPILSEVRCLDLRSCKLDAAALVALAGSRRLGHLLRLVLHGNPLGDEGAQILAASRTLPRLAELIVRSCDVGEVGIRALRDAGHTVAA